MSQPDTVRPADGPLRFFVVSDSDADVDWLVQLDSYKGHGKCACPDFDLRKRPAVELAIRVGEPIPDELRCKHIRRARQFFCTAMIALILEKTPGHNPNHDDHNDPQ